MAINSVDDDGRIACQQTGFCFQGCKWGAKWSTAYTEIPRARRPATSRCATDAMSLQIEHDDDGQGDRRRLRRQGRQAAAAEGAHRLRRRQLDREPAAAAELGLGDVPATGWPTPRARSGATTCATPPARSTRVFDKPVQMWRGTTMAGHHPRRGAPRPVARLRRRLRAGDAQRSACRSWRPSSIPAPGGASSPPRSTATTTWPGMWIVGEDMPQETNRVTLNHEVKDQYGLPVAERALRRPPQRRRDAQPRLRAGRRRSTRRSARRAPSRRRPIRRPTTSAPTG